MNYLIILFYILQRLFEIWLNAKNESRLIKKYNAVVVDQNEIKVMKLFHGLWFFSLLTESVHHGKILIQPWSIVFGIVLLIAMIIRFHSIRMLGEFWTVQVYKVNNQPICKSGLYKYIRHPNYLAVIMEFIFLPLILGCPVTLVIGFVMNLFVLKRRILLEEANLGSTSNYNKIFGLKKRFIPGLF